MALELGACKVYFGTSGAEVDLGKTNGGVTVRIADTSADLKSDQNGESPEDTVITGTTVEVELQLAEMDLSKLNSILQSQNASPNDDFVAGENRVGTSLLAIAKSLLLKKFVNGVESTDVANHITFPKAAPISNVELKYDGTNQRVVACVFKCFPATVSANWGTATAIEKTVTYYFGDNTVTS
jgi:hypothetical protein